MTENQLNQLIAKIRNEPYFAKSVLKGAVAADTSDRVKMEAWLVVAQRFGPSEARKNLPTPEMVVDYQTATGKNPLEGLDVSIKRAIAEPLTQQYGEDTARRMLGLPVKSTPPAAEPEPEPEPEPENTEGSYADYLSGETKTETTPTPEATVPPDTEDGTGNYADAVTGKTSPETTTPIPTDTEDNTGNYADAITGGVDPVWDEIKRNALEQVNDPHLPDHAKMQLWLELAEKYGEDAANSIFVPTDAMWQDYQTDRGELAPSGFEKTEKTEGSYADYLSGETKTETTPTPEATVPPDTEDDTGNYADAITGGVDPVWDEIKRNALEQVNDPNLPGHAKMQLWRELAEQYGMDAANSIFVPTDEMAWSYEQDRGENPWAGFEYGEPGSYKKYVESKIGNSDPEFEPQGEVVPSTDYISDDMREETTPTDEPESGDVGDGLLTPSTDKVTGTPPTVEVSKENPSYSFEGGNIGDDTGDEFDEKLKKNEEIANLNIREGAMTYEEWMKSAGIDTQRDYNAAAKAAAKEYDRSLGTYGATAEAMGRAGLSGSGYSDYLTGNAYAARQGSMDTARQTKTLADDASRQGYMNYLQDYEEGQRGNIAAAIGELSAMGLTGDKAKQYLSMMGIDSGYADYVVGIVDEMAAEGDPDKQALLTEILSNNLSGDVALSYAKFLGFDDATAAEVIGMADQLMVGQKEEENAAKKDSVLDYFITNFANLNRTGALVYGQYHGLDEDTVEKLYKTAEAITAGAVESNSKAKVQAAYNYIIQTGMTGDIAKEWAMELGGLDETEVSELVDLTDKIISTYGASTAGAKEAAEVVVDIGYKEISWIERIADIVSNPFGILTTGGRCGYSKEEYAKLDADEKEFVDAVGKKLKAAVSGITEEDQKKDAWIVALVDVLYDRYASEGYSDAQITKIFELGGMSQLAVQADKILKGD